MKGLRSKVERGQSVDRGDIGIDGVMKGLTGIFLWDSVPLGDSE